MISKDTAFGTPCQPHSVRDLNYRIRMIENDNKKVLWDNLLALMKKHYGRENFAARAISALFA